MRRSGTITAQGLLRIEDERLVMDAQLCIWSPASLTSTRWGPSHWGADRQVQDENRLALNLTCGDSDLVQDVRYGMRGEQLVLHVGVTFGPASLAVDLEFDPVEQGYCPPPKREKA